MLVSELGVLPPNTSAAAVRLLRAYSVTKTLRLHKRSDFS